VIGVFIRRARAADAEATWKVHLTAIRETAVSHYSPEQIAAWASSPTPQLHEASIRQAICYVAEGTAGEIVGFATLMPRTGEVAAVYVTPAHGRRGIGRRLLTSVEAAARECGLTALHLDASLNAVEFYTRAGYVAERPGLHRLRSGVDIPCIRMIKTVTVHDDHQPETGHGG
jgi:putative acetyltransferase